MFLSKRATADRYPELISGSLNGIRRQYIKAMLKRPDSYRDQHDSQGLFNY